jgi:hypothetical protein
MLGNMFALWKDPQLCLALQFELCRHIDHPVNRRPLFHLNKVRETLEAQSSKVGGEVQESRGKRSLVAGGLPKIADSEWSSS